MIEAERGEFIMNRSAVQELGIENLNRMNRGMGSSRNINITFEGNVLSEDFPDQTRANGFLGVEDA